MAQTETAALVRATADYAKSVVAFSYTADSTSATPIDLAVRALLRRYRMAPETAALVARLAGLGGRS